MLPSDFWRVLKMPILAEDGSQMFMAYDMGKGMDNLGATKFKGKVKIN